MNFRRIKNNRFIRGLYFGYHSLFSYKRSTFGHLSDGAFFSPKTFIVNPANVFINGDIGLEDASIYALNAKFIIKKGCAVANGLTVVTGNHARVIGTYVGELLEENKPKGYDKDVIVNEDVWLGSNVTLLSGVSIGRGATVAAGAVVTKDIPPYCICGGIPARFIKFYWTIEEIVEHELKLYPESERFTRSQLIEIFQQYK